MVKTITKIVRKRNENKKMENIMVVFATKAFSIDQTFFFGISILVNVKFTTEQLGSEERAL